MKNNKKQIIKYYNFDQFPLRIPNNYLLGCKYAKTSHKQQKAANAQSTKYSYFLPLPTTLADPTQGWRYDNVSDPPRITSTLVFGNPRTVMSKSQEKSMKYFL